MRTKGDYNTMPDINLLTLSNTIPTEEAVLFCKTYGVDYAWADPEFAVRKYRVHLGEVLTYAPPMDESVIPTLADTVRTAVSLIPSQESERFSVYVDFSVLADDPYKTEITVLVYNLVRGSAFISNNVVETVNTLREENARLCKERDEALAALQKRVPPPRGYVVAPRLLDSSVFSEASIYQEREDARNWAQLIAGKNAGESSFVYGLVPIDEYICGVLPVAHTKLDV
jgi:hypothetical protein